MTDSSQHPLWRRAALLCCLLVFFFLSGACGLIYQVAWTRELVLLLGARAYAVSLVLTIYFLGLGLGSLLGGRMADRIGNPLRCYALLEAGVGVWALLLLVGLGLSEQAVVALLRAWGMSWFSGVLLRAAAAALLLLLPVMFMGATLPLLARFATSHPALAGSRTGLLYTVNTLGAMTGCFLAGFVFLAQWGYQHTILLAAGINLAVALGAWGLSRVAGGRVETIEAPGEATLPACAAGPGSTWWLVAAFGVSGFAALALEVVWTRLLAMVFLGTTYAYTAMLTTLLCGLAVGGLAGSLIATRLRNASGVAGALLALLGIFYLLLLHGFAWLPGKYAEVMAASGNRWDETTWGMFRLAFVMLFPAAFISGELFPILVRAVAQSAGRIGRDVGLLYGANTLGGVLGAAAGGFVLLPLLGAQNSIVLLALLPFLAGIVLMLRCPACAWKKRVLNVLLISVAFGLVWWPAPRDISKTINASYMPKEHEVIYYREGAEGTVAVSQPRGDDSGSNRVLWINRVQATTSIERGVKMNRLQGVLPLLFDRDPKEILFMCFGSGITCGTLALSPFDRIDAVEICPDVLRAAPLFAKDNLGVLDRPNARFIIDDGRNFLLTTRNRYDLITFEPMPLAVAGVSTFYTADYYRLCLSRLKPRGLVSQWVPLHSLSPELVQSLVRTFTSVFPEYCAFFVNADLFLIGSNAPLKLDWAAAQSRTSPPALARALAASGLPDTVELMGSFLMDKAGLDQFAGSAEIMTDDRPWAEYEAPKLVYARQVPNSLALLAPNLSSPLGLMDAAALDPAVKAALETRHASRANDILALKEYYGGLTLGDTALNGFLESLRIDPANPNARYYLTQIVDAQARAFIRWAECDKAAALLDKVRPYLADTGVFQDLERQAAGCIPK